MTTIVKVLASVIVVASVIMGQVRAHRGKPPIRILAILGPVAVLYLFFVPTSHDIRDAALAAVALVLLFAPMVLFDRDIAEVRRKRESERKVDEARNE